MAVYSADALLPSVAVAVMTVRPGFIPFTSPLLLTVAIFLLAEEYLTLTAAPEALTALAFIVLCLLK